MYTSIYNYVITFNINSEENRILIQSHISLVDALSVRYVFLLYDFISHPQMICDGSRQYAEKIEDILENNGYYDFIDNQQFDVTDQVGLKKII